VLTLIYVVKQRWRPAITQERDESYAADMKFWVSIPILWEEWKAGGRKKIKGGQKSPTK